MKISAIANITAQVGSELGVSEWYQIGRSRISRFAEVTED